MVNDRSMQCRQDFVRFKLKKLSGIWMVFVWDSSDLELHFQKQNIYGKLTFHRRYIDQPLTNTCQHINISSKNKSGIGPTGNANPRNLTSLQPPKTLNLQGFMITFCLTFHQRFIDQPSTTLYFSWNLDLVWSKIYLNRPSSHAKRASQSRTAI